MGEEVLIVGCAQNRFINEMRLYRLMQQDLAQSRIAQLEKEADWLATNLANALIDPDFVAHLADLGGMSPPDPQTLRDAAREAVVAGRK